MRVMRAVFGAALLATVGACGALGRDFKEPIVTFKDGRITGLGLTGGSLEVVLGVYNPNGYKLDGSRLTYSILVDSVKFGEGEYNSPFEVQKGETTMVRLPLSFSYAGVGNAGRQLMNTGSVEYRVQGAMTFGTPIGNFTRPYDQRGRFSTLSGNR